MDDSDGARDGRRSFKQRLGLNGFGCCGAHWGLGGGRTAAIGGGDDATADEMDDREEEPPLEQRVLSGGRIVAPVNNLDPGCVGPITTGSGMNLAAALAAERQFRPPQDSEEVGPTGNRSAATTVPATPMRVSLMRLLEETEMDGCDAFGSGALGNEKSDGGGVGSDTVCCVCMVRKKGAAFIPCGHTFCRVCSREVWLNRGSCPLCNRPILEILDIF